MPFPLFSSRHGAVRARAARPCRARPRAAALGLAALGAAGGVPAGAQPAGTPPAGTAPAAAPPFDPTWLGATPGTEAENYLRAAQVAGVVPLGTLAIRPLGPAELRALTAGLAPDGSQPARGRALGARGAAARVAVLPAAGSVAYQLSYPWAVGQGPVWEGRGATAVARAGAAARFGVLTVVAQPVAFVAQNRAFAPTPNGFPTSAGPYEDFVLPGAIDRPQRFGAGAYARVDPGNSFVRLDAGPVAVGASAAAQAWGPGVAHPLMLGPNAGGFPHLFVGTARPVGVGVGRLHLRSVVGRPASSPVFDRRGERVVTAAVAVFSPRGVPGLELGATRFFHVPSPPARLSLDLLTRPFEGIFINAERSYDPNSPDSQFQSANQLASGFASWTFPRAGLRAYGEYLRNDNPIDERDLVVEPDHSSAYLLGLQRAFRRGAGEGASLTSVRAEWVNGRVTRIVRVRTQTSVYGHNPVTQGHTHRGQLLGSAAALGGSGGQLAVDHYARRGRVSVVLDRLTRAQQDPFEGEATLARGWNVQHALTATRVWQRGPVQLTAEATAIQELNRDFRRDAWDARARAGVGWTF